MVDTSFGEQCWTVPQLVVWLFVVNLHSSKQTLYEPLPSWVWLLTPRQVVILITGMAHGVGSHDEHKCFCCWCGSIHQEWDNFSTVSKHFADELQALAMHAGMYSAITTCRNGQITNHLTGEPHEGDIQSHHPSARQSVSMYRQCNRGQQLLHQGGRPAGDSSAAVLVRHDSRAQPRHTGAATSGRLRRQLP